ncbi:Alpha/Beta hydrolase protein [Multifurca ochricompacta]|uniref:Alpha/Beta hydrolase protein n=1 Tax=Multifurca ochricompacta TaxID=376703 RepID=A0AAD4LXW5_9AGAM|nr:Alpha/Beta hydrolase protein [Multifurca ochricompacta]
MTAVIIPKPLSSQLQRARRFCLILGGIYILLVALGTTPFAQGQLLFMHNLKLPFFAQYDMPEKYDLAPFKTHNVRIRTTDNETLGAWFTFADPFYAAHKAHLFAPPSNLSSLSSLSSSSSSTDDLIRAALRAHPTILFLHGTTGTRVVRIRVQHYQAFATRLRANVLAPDYRGFADSTGTPSEAGLTLDTRAAWDWLRARGASPESVLVVGNSLGTGVAVQFASALEEFGRTEAEEAVRERPRGVVLLSPFSKLETLLDTYYILGLVPLFAPLRTFPYLANFVKKLMINRFDSLAKIVGLKVPLLIVHAEDDLDIPVSHAQMLFDAFLEKHLPPFPEITAEMMKEGNGLGASPTPTVEVPESFATLSQERTMRRRELVSVREMERVGRVEVFSKDRPEGEVVFLRSWWGAHDVGLVEGVQDYMAEMFNMG